MKRELEIWWCGVTCYLISFPLLAAVGSTDSGQYSRFWGWNSAFFCLVAPWVWLDQWSKGALPWLMPMTLLCGWINPSYLIATSMFLRPMPNKIFSVFRAITIALIPCSFVILRIVGLRPREGFFLWIAGIVISLFARPLASIFGSPAPEKRLA
jgi:hypothetical protein